MSTLFAALVIVDKTFRSTAESLTFPMLNSPPPFAHQALLNPPFLCCLYCFGHDPEAAVGEDRTSIFTVTLN